MTEKGMENNKVTVIGTIVSGFTFSHAVFGEGFYLVDLLVNRLSEQADIIPLMISERLIDVTKDYQAAPWRPPVSSGPTTATRGRRTVWYCPCLSERSALWRSSRTTRKRTRSFWTDISVKNRSTGRRQLGREIADL